MKFHHGREVTAHDGVYSFTRLLNLQKPIPVTDLFGRIQGAKEFMEGKAHNIQGLKAVDRYTLQMVLEEPLASALVVLGLANAAVVPQEEVEKRGDPSAALQWAPGRSNLCGGSRTRRSCWRPTTSTTRADHILTLSCSRSSSVSKLEERFAEFLQGNLEETIIPSGKLDEVRADPGTGSISASVNRRSASSTSDLTRGLNPLTISGAPGLQLCA